jgi:hypothetical protein
MMKLSISVLVFSLSVVSMMGLNGCDRQVPPPKAVKEPPPDSRVQLGRDAVSERLRTNGHGG